MIRDTYYHLDVDGESGRKMREATVFGDLGGGRVSGSANERKSGATTGNGSDDTGDMLNFSLRGA